MFEYYKYKLANQLTTKSKQSELKEVDVLGKKGWGLSTLLALTFSLFIVFTRTGGMLTSLLSTVSITLAFIWLVASLKKVKWQEMSIKMAQFLGFLIIAAVLISMLFGMVSTMLHYLMRESHHLGQVATIIEFTSQGILLLASPVLIVTCFRFIDRRTLWAKIRIKTYLELLILIALGLIVGQFPNAIIFRNLILTYLFQLLCFTMLNTLVITALITTCKNRGVLV